MSKKYKFEGKTYIVPDDASLEEVQALIDGTQPQQVPAPRQGEGFWSAFGKSVNPLPAIVSTAQSLGFDRPGGPTVGVPMMIANMARQAMAAASSPEGPSVGLGRMMFGEPVEQLGSRLESGEYGAAAGGIAGEATKYLGPLALAKFGGGFIPKRAPGGMTYAGAKELIKTAPERSIALQADIQAARAADTALLEADRRGIRRLAPELSRREIAPLREQKKAVLDIKTQTSAAVGEAEKARAAKLVTERDVARAKTTAEKAALQEKLDVQAREAAQGIGTPMAKTEIAAGAEKSRLELAKGYSQKTTEILDDVRKEVYAKNIQDVSTGEFTESVTKDIYGIEKVTKEPKTQPMEAPISLASTKQALQKIADRYKINLASIKGMDSPASRIITQIVDGPDMLPADSVYLLKSALNRYGYSNADPVTRPAEALARIAAHEVKASFEESLGAMTGGKGGAYALDRLKEVSANQAAKGVDLITGPVNKFGTLARTSAKSVETTGNVAGMMNNPNRFKAAWGQLDDATQAGVRHQVAQKIVGSGFKDLQRNLAKVDPEVRQMVFTSEQNASLDALAVNGQKAVKDLAGQAYDRYANILQENLAETMRLAKIRSEIKNLTLQNRQLADTIRSKKDWIRGEKERAITEYELNRQEIRRNTREAETMARMNYAAEMRMAREKIAKMKSVMKWALVGATVSGLGVYGRHILSLLGL